MAPRLPRMFWGEIIYATPGSGKTYVANKYEDVIDADDLIVQVIDQNTNFNVAEYNDPREVIGRYFNYIHYNRALMNRIYDAAVELMNIHKDNNDVVLLGTKDLMHIADRVFIQDDQSIVRGRFDQSSEDDKLDDALRNSSSPLYRSNVHNIDGYLDGALQKLAAGRL